MDRADRLVGCLIGTAVGDSLLLPAEGLARERVARWFPGELRQRLIVGHGMVSDDTEHAFLTTQALLAAGDDAARFGRALACRLRWWLLSLPGGCGKATALGLLRSWVGFPPGRSGVNSAGNGPAMRSAIIGLRWADDQQRRRDFVTVSTTITHRDERALAAALAVAEAAAVIARGDSTDLLWEHWRACSGDASWIDLVAGLERHYRAGDSVDAYATALGCPHYVSGYAFHSVPVALFAWLRHRGDPSTCLAAILRCGGDTDTMGAIAGALLGAEGGEAGFNPKWTADLAEWPMSLVKLRLAGRALRGVGGKPVRWCWPAQLLRNLLFLMVILGHGFRRLLP